MSATLCFHEDGNVLYAVGPALVQVRRGPLTTQLIDRIESYGRLHRASHGGSFGFLAVILPGAPIAGPEAMARQAEVISTLSARKAAPIVLVTLEDDVQASMHRVRSRVYRRGGATIYFAASLADGARELARLVDVDAAEVTRTVEEGRALLATAP